MGSVLLSGQGEAAAATVVVAAASLTGLTRTAQGVGLRTHQGVDESASSSRSTSGWQVVSRSASTAGQSILWAVGHRVESFARVTLVGPAKNHRDRSGDHARRTLARVGPPGPLR